MSSAPSSSTQAQPADQRARNFEWPLSLSAWNAVDDTWAPPSQQPKEYKQENRATATRPPRKFVWPLSLRVWNTVDDCWAVYQSPSESSSDLVLTSGGLSERLSIITVDRLRVYVNYVLRITGFVIAWATKTAKGVVRRVFRLNPEFVEETDEEVNPDGTPKTNAKLVSKVNKVIHNTPLAMFFSHNSKFIEELAGKAAALADDPGTPICGEKLLPKTAQVTMHQQVLYFDDRTFMDTHRWDFQNELINRIARVTTRILPEGEVIYLGYVNHELPKFFRFGSEFEEIDDLADVIKPLTWGGDTPVGMNQKSKPILRNITSSAHRAIGTDQTVGTNLKREVLEPLVYRKLPYNLPRPLLISVIIDKVPGWEPESDFVQVIIDCGHRLENAGLPRESVKFMIGQVGSATGVTEFLQDVSKDWRIENVVFVATEKLDDALSKLKNDWEIDEWLIETLYAPIMKSESKKDR